MSPAHSYLAVALLAAVTVVGDYFIKLASLESHPINSKWFWEGCLIYASSAFGWVYVMRHIKLSTLGLMFSLSIVLLLTGLGVAVFGETLTRYEVVGIGLGVASIILLVRFGG